MDRRRPRPRPDPGLRPARAAHRPRKGTDRLPAADTDRLRASLVGGLDPDGLHTALTAITRVLLEEIHTADSRIAAALHRPLLELTTW